MQDFARRLYAGPAWRTKPARGLGAYFLLAPFLLLAALVLSAAFVALIKSSVHAQVLLETLEGGAVATGLALVLAIPASLLRPGWAWMVALLLVLSASLAAWPLLGLQQSRPPVAIEAAGCLLPVLVLWLAGAWPRSLATLASGAACAGAGRGAILTDVLLPLAWPALRGACLIGFPLGCGAVAVLGG